MPREMVDTGTDKRYVRRDAAGRFVESDDVGRSVVRRSDYGKKANNAHRQLPLGDWPLGLEVQAAQLSLTPSDITSRSGITFAQGHDDLDDFEAAVVDLGDQVFALQAHKNSPVPGTVVLVSEGSADALWLAAYVLKLEPKEIAWVSPRFRGWRQKLKRQGKAVNLAEALKAAAAAIRGKQVKHIIPSGKSAQKKLRA